MEQRRSSRRQHLMQTWLFILLASVPCIVLAQDDGGCPLDCQNGSTCKQGSADYSNQPTEPNGAIFTFLEGTSRDGWFCECPDDFTGLRCGRPYKICPSADVGIDSDPHVCYHGGSCIDGIEDNAEVASDQRFCDCSKAEYNGVPYFGKYCEIEGAVQCGPGSEIFCAAHGQCKEDFETKAHPCSCPEGHRGPHCEFLRGQVPDCDLTCQNGGECSLGIKEFDEAKYADFWRRHNGNFQYCECPPGWFGEDCTIPGVECGNAHCFNGGACLETLNDNGDKTYVCDCKEATHDDKSYAGQYCEAEATDSCANSQPNANGSIHPNGHLFCTNGGTCNKEAPHLGCDCPPNRHGPRCEYDNPNDAKCSLDCQNGGTCRKGKKDNSIVNALGKGMAHYNITHSQLFEHCVCPDEYFGIQCEHKLEICPGGDHVCLHGSKCVAENEGEGGEATSHKCDCDEGFDAVERYAGKFCQYTSTDICTKNGNVGVGKANFAFCVNNGICKAKVEDNQPHPGCNCEDGYSGDHCEFLSSDSGSSSASSSSGGSNSGGSGSSASGSSSPVSTSMTTENESNQSTVIGIAAALIAILVISGFFVVRALVKGGGKRRGGKTSANEAAAAVAAAEQDAANSSTSMAEGSSKLDGQQQQPFDEASAPPLPLPVTPVVGRFDGEDGEFEDVEDYSNDMSDTSTLTEDDMSNVQIV